MVRFSTMQMVQENNEHGKWMFVLILGLFLMGSGTVAALDGNEVLAEVDTVMQSDTRSMNQTMTLYSSSGQSRTRELQVFSDSTSGEDQMLVRFTAPADVRGTGLLMDGDDMFLYMPALGRVRRIAGHAKQGSFMGSDFSYVDMEQFGTRGFSVDYSATFAETESYGDRESYRLELEPTSESEYSKLTMWVDSERYLPLQIQYFDEQGEHFKTLVTSNFALFDDRWTATNMLMENVQSGTKTEMIVEQVDFHVVFDAGTFTTRNLERGQ